MNAVEQKNHKRVTDAIANDVAAIAEETADRLDALKQVSDNLRDLINAERTHRLDMAKDQRGYVDNEDRQLRQCCQERWDATSTTTKKLGDAISRLRDRGFWGRMKWILRGL